MGTTCDVCSRQMEVTDDEMTEKRSVTFSSNSAKASAKITVCPECFLRLTRIQVGTDSVGQALCIPKLTWKKWPQRDADK